MHEVGGHSDKTMTYQLIEEHCPSFLERAAQSGGLPDFIVVGAARRLPACLLRRSDRKLELVWADGTLTAMAATWMLRRELHEILAEVAGYKAGLALSQDELLDHLSDEEMLLGDLVEVVRIRHEHLDEVVRRLLYRLGALRHPPTGGPAITLYAKYHSNPDSLRILNCLLDELSVCVRRKYTTGMPGPVDIIPIAERAMADFGRPGLAMFLEFEELLEEHVFGGFMSRFRRTDWKNKEELAGLFDRASITPLHGQFLDQRYVDYLERNTKALDSMHWRNFEALTAEFFAQMGYQVELGVGVGDRATVIQWLRALRSPGIGLPLI